MVAANGSLPIIEQNYMVPITAGRTIGISGITTSSQQAIGEAPARRSITFHNPNNTSQTNLFVCQAKNSAGAAQPALVDGAGSFIIYPGSEKTFVGSVGGAWNVISSALGANLTIIADVP